MPAITSWCAEERMGTTGAFIACRRWYNTAVAAHAATAMAASTPSPATRPVGVAEQVLLEVGWGGNGDTGDSDGDGDGTLVVGVF
jgi:hypothetical protein